MIKKILLVLIGLVALAACQTVQTTPTAVRTIAVKQTEIPLDHNTFTPYPPRKTPMASITPYATASAVKANAVVFIGEGRTNAPFDSSLWAANVDGSGERKLADVKNNESWVSTAFIRWSPDGNWISYISANELWIVSHDGSVNKKIVPISKIDKDILWRYAWSPDSSKMTYIERTGGADHLRLLDLKTGKVSDLLPAASWVAASNLSWSPDGRYILLNTETSVTFFEVATNKPKKEIKVDTLQSECPIWHGGPTWSPNGKWIYHLVYATGTDGLWICVSGLDGSHWQIPDAIISPPVWDSTGNFLYFVVRKTNPDGNPNLKTDEWLMRYDVRTQKSENLLALKAEQTQDYSQSISISPNGQRLSIQSKPSKTTYELTFVDIPSLTKTKFTVDFAALKIPLADDYDSYFLETTWSPDSQKLVLLAGDRCSQKASSGCPHYYGSFYILEVETGKITAFSGSHTIARWLVSPIVAFP